MRLTPCERNRSLFLRTAFLQPMRHHLPIEYIQPQPQPIHITMPRQPVIITKTDKGHEIISDSLRCVCLAQSEYEAHLFLHRYDDTYRLVNTTSKIGSNILQRAKSQGVIPAVPLTPRGWESV